MNLKQILNEEEVAWFDFIQLDLKGIKLDLKKATGEIE